MTGGVEIDPGRPPERFPNPYAFEIVAVLTAAAAGLVLALYDLVTVREALHSAPRGDVLVGLAAFAATFAAAVGLGAMGLRQLNVERGFRMVSPLDRPKDPRARGLEPEEIKRRIRQNDLPPLETSGPFGALLKSLAPHLEGGSQGLQRMAHATFVNLALTVIVALGLAVSLFLSPGGAANDCIGLLYGVVTLGAVAGALRRGHEIPLSPRAFALLLGASVLIPVGLLWARSSLPDLGGFDPLGKVVLALLVFAAASLLALLAIFDQIGSRPPTPPSRAAGVWSVNFDPRELGAQFQRLIEERGAERGWSYGEGDPGEGPVAATGAFQITQCHETMPVIDVNTLPRSPRDFFTLKGYRFVCASTIVAALAWIGAFVAGAAMVTTALDGSAPLDAFVWLVLLASVAAHALRVSHVLWGRMDYHSTLTLIEMSGVIQRVHAAAGNRMTGAFQIDRELVNVENLDVRLWIADLVSVALGPAGSRDMVGFTGPTALADEMMRRLKAFSSSQAMIVAPSSEEDARRAAVIDHLSHSGAGNERMIAAGDRSADPPARD